MVDQPGGGGQEVVGEQAGKLLCAVATSRQAAAFGRPVGAEGGRDEVATGSKRSAQAGEVGIAVRVGARARPRSAASERKAGRRSHESKQKPRLRADDSYGKAAR